MAWFWFMEWLILVYIINRIIHGRLEIWNLSSRIHIRYLTRSLRSLVRYRCEHSKINSISPRDHVLFSIYVSLLPLELEKLLMNDKITASCQSDIFHKHFIKCSQSTKITFKKTVSLTGFQNPQYANCINPFQSSSSLSICASFCMYFHVSFNLVAVATTLIMVNFVTKLIIKLLATISVFVKFIVMTGRQEQDLH